MKRLALAASATVAVLLTASGHAHARPIEQAGGGAKRPSATGTGGAAATVDLVGTRAAIDVLRAGGNAVDAAVAAAAVLGVVEPFSCGIGGGGFMTIYRAKDRSVHTIDSRETAPAAMRPDSFLSGGAVLPFNDARYSGLSTGVPGTVRGWQEALRRFGSKPFGTLMIPAVRAAAGGFEVDQTFADQTTANVPWFDDIASTRDLYLDGDGTAPDVGTTFRNPDLARTYAALALFGPDAFYRGPIADAMVRAVAAPPVAAGADHVWRPGLLTAADLRAYRALERTPTRSDYRGLSIYSMGPPSSGGSTVAEALNILDALPSAGWHEFLEASRYAFADRNAFVADPAYFDVPLRGLLSDDFAASRAALITDRASASPAAPGDPYAFEGRVGPPASSAPTVSPLGSSTTHLTVSDKWGNVVSYTFTIESTGGNGIVVPGYGFLLNNELTDFNIDSTTHPNRAEGGKRPRSSMAPTIVLRDGKPVLALGSPGGATIITTVAQILFDRYGLGTPLPTALAAPRFSQRNAASTAVEPAALTLPFAADLIARGHRLTAGAEIGAATAIEFGPHGRMTAVAEPVRRGGGSAEVVRR
jgi:gamma-glutamyltranspeptidase / glutathione hydrolase